MLRLLSHILLLWSTAGAKHMCCSCQLLSNAEQLPWLVGELTGQTMLNTICTRHVKKQERLTSDLQRQG